MTTDDKLVKDWLSGKKSHDQVNLNPCEQYTRAKSEYMDGAGEYPSLQMMLECLKYTRDTGGALPEAVLSNLIFGIKELLSGREGHLLRKSDIQTAHPCAVHSMELAVGYVKTCRGYGYDENPVATICDHFYIKRRTFQRWMEKFPDARDDIKKELLDIIPELVSRHYLVHANIEKYNELYGPGS